MPGYARFERLSRSNANAVVMGSLNVTWKDEGKAFEYQKSGRKYRYEISAGNAVEMSTNQIASSTDSGSQPRRGGGRRGGVGGPERGRQFSSSSSPDGKYKAVYRDHNLWLTQTNEEKDIAITTEGNATDRIKFGSASWVYGEELFQTTAIWWASNSQKVAFYRFDESKVPDYYIAMRQTSIQDRLDTEPYPKSGGTNPVADLLIYDVASRKTTQVDVRNGGPFTDDSIGHYAYGVSWTPDNRELLFHRTNRRQNILELCAADPDSGKCRVIVHEEWPDSWVENSPTMRFLEDGHRFIWVSERTGWRNFYLYDLNGRLLTSLTHHEFEVADIEHVDEKAGLIYYTARDGDNPMKLQLHRVGLDGKDDRRLTDPSYHHTVNIAPDGRHIIDVAQTHNHPPFTRLLDSEGKVLDELARSDMTHFNRLGFRKVELLKFKAADGKTDLYGMLHFPSNFNPHKSYPLLVSVYAGPATTGARETFTMPNTLTEFGFLVATFDSRSASGRGKRFLDSIYLKLGQTEIDDQAAGVRSLYHRPYVNKHRVGIFGTSYGGTASALSLLRYPGVFQAACSCSPVTDWRNYDTIYTERYMWLPEENKAGYDAGSLMTYASNLKGRLLLYYGTADNNVHPSNSMQLVQALQRAGKSFEVQVGPDQGHGSVNRDRMMEFFIESLVTE
jgi:dipeptidyl-peptidase-4